MSNTIEKLQEMAKLTILTNKINEIQELNMKQYAYLFFEGVNSVVIDYNLSNSMDVSSEEDSENLEISYKMEADMKSMHVTYRLAMEPAVQQTHLLTRFQHLEQSIHTLFWKGIIVRVFFNDQKVYETKNEPK